MKPKRYTKTKFTAYLNKRLRCECCIARIVPEFIVSSQDTCALSAGKKSADYNENDNGDYDNDGEL